VNVLAVGLAIGKLATHADWALLVVFDEDYGTVYSIVEDCVVTGIADPCEIGFV
tara:strand:+ start:435 stop:596 length:162 start_codon:yes stop_codon:yes gene_type:complete